MTDTQGQLALASQSARDQMSGLASDLMPGGLLSQAFEALNAQLYTDLIDEDNAMSVVSLFERMAKTVVSKLQNSLHEMQMLK